MSFNLKIKMPVFLLVICFGGLLGCNAGKDQTNIELIQDMMDQISMKAQDYDDVRKEASNRVPPEGTVAHGKGSNRYAKDPIGAGQNLANPYGSSPEELVLNRGKGHYEIYCMPCHGSTMKGDGIVAQYLVTKPPPSLLTDKVRGYRDGQLYHVITFGQGQMGQYGAQVQNENDRWAIVSYIRQMQKSQ